MSRTDRPEENVESAARRRDFWTKRLRTFAIAAPLVAGVTAGGLTFAIAAGASASTTQVTDAAGDQTSTPQDGGLIPPDQAPTNTGGNAHTQSGGS